MTLLTPTTELEAVNQMLGAIGQSPVSTLEVVLGDALVARSFLADVLRFVQLKGFAFNTDYDYSLSPDVDDVILVPNGALRVDPTDPAQDLVVRTHPTKGLALWDRANQTWECSEAVKCDITWGFGFEELPEVARNYIAKRASALFQARIVGSGEIDRLLSPDVGEAWTLLCREERASRDTNLFRNNKTMLRQQSRSYRGR